ncbi:MAG: T9SS type A sorting domain-containing protein, partial [Bacteroidota bacterium]
GAQPLEIKTVSLMDAGNNSRIGPLGSQVSTRDAGLSIEAKAGDCAESVRFTLRNAAGQILINRVESVPPYTLLGDNPGPNYIPWFPSPGAYTLTLRAYSENRGNGRAGNSKVLNFTVLANHQLVSEENTAIEIYPNPSTGEKVQIKLNLPWDGSAQFRLLDHQGQSYREVKLSERQFDLSLSEVPPGVYILEVKNAFGSYQKTLIVNK